MVHIRKYRLCLHLSHLIMAFTFVCVLDGMHPAVCCCMCNFPMITLCDNCRQKHCVSTIGSSSHCPLPISAKDEIASREDFDEMWNWIPSFNHYQEELISNLNGLRERKSQINDEFTKAKDHLEKCWNEGLEWIEKCIQETQCLIHQTVQEVYANVKNGPKSSFVQSVITRKLDLNPWLDVHVDLNLLKKAIIICGVEPVFGISSLPENAFPLQVTLKLEKAEKTVAVPALLSDTLADVKMKLERRLGHVPPESYFHTGNGALSQEYTLESCQFTWNSVVFLSCFVNISVIFSEKKSLKKAVDLRWTVRNLLDSLQVEVYKQLPDEGLLYQGQWQDEESILAHCGISDGVEVRIFRRINRNFQLKVYIPGGNYVNYTAENADIAVFRVKEEVSNACCLSSSLYLLEYQEEILVDSLSLAFYDIKDNCELKLVPNPSIQVDISIKTSRNFSQFLFFPITTTIKEVKETLIQQNLTNFPSEKQILVYNHIILHDDYTLAAYNISTYSVFDLHESAHLEIYICSDITESFMLAVQPMASIKDLKAQFTCFPPDKQRIIYENEELKDESLLANYNIREGAVLLVREQLFPVDIIMQDGAVFTLDVAASDIVQDVKARIQSQVHISLAKKSLFVGEQELNAGTLDHYDVGPGSKIRIGAKSSQCVIS